MFPGQWGYFMPKKKRILFVCTENSARSLMAEALMRNQAGDRYEVFSAGTSPSSPDRRALETIASFAGEIKDLRSKHLDEFEGESFDYVISLCEKASFECEPLHLGKQFMAWNFEDPKTRSGPNPFNVTLKEINERIKMFLLVMDKETQS